MCLRTWGCFSGDLAWQDSIGCTQQQEGAAAWQEGLNHQTLKSQVRCTVPCPNAAVQQFSIQQQSGVVQGPPAMTIKVPQGCSQRQLPYKSD